MTKETAVNERFLEALSETAQELLSEEFPTIAERASVEVKYFGKGERYEVRRDGDEISIVLFFHAQDGAKLPETIRRAAEAAKRISAQRVSVRASSIRKLLQNGAAHTLSRSELQEIQSLLDSPEAED